MLHKKIKIKLLISVRNLEEISIVNKYSDIIDLKDPSRGSLGSWDREQILKAINQFKDKVFSATLGNVEENKKIKDKLLIFDKLGLNYIKIGFFQETLSSVKALIDFVRLTNFKTKLVAVIFAEKKNILDFVLKNSEIFYNAGFSCILIDTFEKKSSNLLSCCSSAFLTCFISKLKHSNLLIGLAGKLQLEHFPTLIKLNPDIIGLRSAACNEFDRKKNITEKSILRLKTHFNSEIKKAHDEAGA